MNRYDCPGFFRYKTGYEVSSKLKVIGFMSAKTGITPLNASRTALLLRPRRQAKQYGGHFQSSRAGVNKEGFYSTQFLLE